MTFIEIHGGINIYNMVSISKLYGEQIIQIIASFGNNTRSLFSNFRMNILNLIIHQDQLHKKNNVYSKTIIFDNENIKPILNVLISD
jgi:hypothetical protein